MADREDFQAQISSILELLAQSAVAQICGLVEEGYAALRRQVERGEQEKEALRWRLQVMDERMRSCERKMRRRSQRPELVGGTDDHQPQVSPPPAASEEKHIHGLKEEAEVLPLVKQEKPEKEDCSLDLKVEVNIRANCSLPGQEPERENPPEDVLDTSLTRFASSTSQLSPPTTEATVDLTCRSEAKRRSKKLLSCSVVQSSKVTCRDLTGSLTDDIHIDETTDDELCLQLSTPMDSDKPCAERLSSLGLDLAWMQERVSHLGAAYAVAQLGLGNTDTGLSSTAFTRQGGGDSLDGPPAMLFTGGSQEMAAFATSFDMTAVAAAVIAPPPTASAATTITQRQPYRNSISDKEPAVCTVCRRVLPTATALEQHQRIHTGERPYTCPHCGKGFAQPNNLRVHLLVHTGERRYRCSLCGKSFISSSHLKRHRTVHTQEKPYSCSCCGQSFSQMCSVRRHRQQSQCGL